MPDYSGYAPRQQQQDPNLAAWAQIGGNIANIFGLDPAKAAEARRGLQQEDYNEQRNQAQIRQQLANKRLGELLGKLNPATGEFDNPNDFGEYARLTAELGSNPNTRMGTGFGAREIETKIAAEERAGSARDKRDKENYQRQLARKQEADDETDNTTFERNWKDAEKTGSSFIRVSPAAGAGKFYRLVTEGGNGGAVLPFDQSLGFSRVTDATRGLPENQQKREPSEGFNKWIKSSGFGSKSIPVEIEDRLRDSGTNLEDERKAVAAELIRKFGTQLSQGDIEDIADRIIASELTAMQQKYKTAKDPVIRVTGPDELQKILLEQSQLPADQRATSIIYRDRVKGKLSEKYNYRKFTLQDLLTGKENEQHPLFGR